MNADTQQFIEELKARPEVCGVVMFGSWARGNNRPDSDVDLLVIVTEGFKRAVEYKNTQAFEIIYITAEAAVEFWNNKKDDCAGLWAVAKILYDKDGTVKTLQEKAQAILAKGKAPIDTHQKGQFKFSAEDEIRAVEAMVDNDTATAHLLLNYVVLALTSHFFDLRQMWVPAPKQRLLSIAELDPKLYAVLKEFYSDTSLANKITAAKKMIPLLFN